jgi:hypothetical protein
VSVSQSQQSPKAASRAAQAPIRPLFALATVAVVGGWLAAAGGLPGARAQALFPNSAGAQFCMLRRAGASYNEALRIAIGNNINPNAQRHDVRLRSGAVVDLTTLQMVDYIVKACPHYLEPRVGGVNV